MANTYESKFKGVEVDEGVNIARNLAGTGGIEVKKTATGTINATVTIDGSGKQDTITNQTSLNVGALNVNGTITGKDLSMTGNVNIEGVQVSITGETITFDSAHDDITFKSRYNAPVVFDVAAQFKGPSGAMFYLGDTGEYVKLMPAMNGSGIYDVRLPDTGGTLALTSDIRGTTITADGVVKTAMNASSTGGTGVLLMTDEDGGVYCRTLHADVSAEYCDAYEYTAETAEQKNYRTTLQPTGIYFEWTGGSHPDLAEGSNRTLTLCGPLSTSTTTTRDNVIRLPAKSGTVALLSDITGGGSAGVSSIGGKTGAITLSTGLAMSGQQLVNKVKVYTSGNYLCIDTN